MLNPSLNSMSSTEKLLVKKKSSPQKKSLKKSNTGNFWQKKVEEFEKSDLSIKVFCEYEGLAKSTFGSWRKKLSTKKSHLKVVEKQKPTEFVSILLNESKDDQTTNNSKKNKEAGEFTLNFGYGISLLIPDNFDESRLQRIVQVLTQKWQKS